MAAPRLAQVGRLCVLSHKATLTVSRCLLRSARDTLLPPLRLHLTQPKPLHPQRHPRRLQRQVRECRLYSFYPRTVPKSLPRHTLPVSAGHEHHALYCAHRDQESAHEFGGCASRWQAGLDDCAKECVGGVDGTHVEPCAEAEYQDGELHTPYTMLRVKLTDQEPSTLG